ncbi:class I SAM-dependent methyltransferase [Bacillus shivajii]|uniref:tRNA (mnm(5)s(2)U34)-methyltransferase n=1 Tax=Bacillus shivajii TaxID=1983719 RepID=UPI001CFC0691|nr:class I SAM-dependent methyltransferase [Bacillus shivajii]UCZ52371.1 class I SAM-dependent methyltransferase [Bacillus shivajii]
MKLDGILPFARTLLEKSVPVNGVAIDATAGNGHDTVFLAKLVKEHGTVYSFDVQEQAIEKTNQRIQEQDVKTQVQVIHDGHENIDLYLKQEHQNGINGAIFNLGYLPGSDKTVTTTPDTTIEAIGKILNELKKEGILVLVVYHGHHEGKVEKDQLLPFVRNLPQEDYHVLEYQFTNQKNDPPFIIAIEKR